MRFAIQVLPSKQLWQLLFPPLHLGQRHDRCLHFLLRFYYKNQNCEWYVLLLQLNLPAVVGYCFILLTGILAQTLGDNFFSNDDTPRYVIILISCVAPFNLYRGLKILADGVGDNRNGWAFTDITSSGLADVYYILIIQWGILMALGL